MIPIAQTRSLSSEWTASARTHTYAVINARTAEQIDCQQFPTTRAGLDRAHRVGRATDAWRSTPCGSSRALVATEHSYFVLRATPDTTSSRQPRMSARDRHGIGKSDSLDARAIGTAVLGA